MTEAEKRFLHQETDTKPNKIAGLSMLIAIGVLAITLILTEMGVFRVERTLMRVSSILGIAVAAGSRILGGLPATREKKIVKYVYMFSAIVISFIVTGVLNFHTTLCLILPLMLATLYKSKKLALVAWSGSMLITLAAPVISFNAGIWDTLFLQVLLQLCGFDSAPALMPFFTAAESTGQIVLYMVLPREMMMILFGFVTYSIVSNASDALNDRLELMRSAQREREMQFGVLDGLAAIIDSRDGSTGMHVVNTKRYTEMLVNYILTHHLLEDRITPEFGEMVINAAPLHDIGKISIPDSVLKKPGKFTGEEYAVMKTHPVAGDSVIRRMFSGNPDQKFAAVVQDVVYYHHENVDGTGYPNGVKGAGIPIAARIVAIADAFDAMTASRVYREGMSAEAAFEQLKKDAGTRFDGELVSMFISAYQERGAGKGANVRTD